MKLWKIIYLSCISLSALMTFLFYNIDLYIPMFFMAMVCIGGLILYTDLIETKSTVFMREPKKVKQPRRVVHFHSLSEEQQEQHLIDLEKKIKEKSK